MDDISPKLQNQIAQFQAAAAAAAAVLSQKFRMESQLKEMEMTIEELKKSPEDGPVYKNVGSLMIKVLGQGRPTQGDRGRQGDHRGPRQDPRPTGEDPAREVPDHAGTAQQGPGCWRGAFRERELNPFANPSFYHSSALASKDGNTDILLG